MRTKWMIPQLRVQRQISCDHGTLHILCHNAICTGPFHGLVNHSFNIRIMCISKDHLLEWILYIVCFAACNQFKRALNVWVSFSFFLWPYYDDHCRLMKVTFLTSLHYYYYTSENIMKHYYRKEIHLIELWLRLIALEAIRRLIFVNESNRWIDAIEHGARDTMQNSPLTSHKSIDT